MNLDKIEIWYRVIHIIQAVIVELIWFAYE